MLKPHEIQNSVRDILNRLGRKTTEVTHLDTGELIDGEHIDSESVSVVKDGVVQVRQTTHKRMFECGHIASASSVAAMCDNCGRMVCENCITLCHKCNLYVCRYCTKIFIDKESGDELTLCNFPCFSDVKRNKMLKKAGKSIVNFFAKK